MTLIVNLWPVVQTLAKQPIIKGIVAPLKYSRAVLDGGDITIINHLTFSVPNHATTIQFPN